MEDLVKVELRYSEDGKMWFPTEEYKHALMIDLAKRFGLARFIETGTCEGHGVDFAKDHFSEVYSIELAKHYYQAAVEKFKSARNVSFIQGDSAVQLEKLLNSLPKVPTLFYLDAHFSGGKTVGRDHLPLQAELKTILGSKVEGIVLIDDCVPWWDYGIPEIAEKTVLEYFPNWQFEIKAGMGRVWRQS